MHLWDMPYGSSLCGGRIYQLLAQSPHLDDRTIPGGVINEREYRVILISSCMPKENLYSYRKLCAWKAKNDWWGWKLILINCDYLIGDNLRVGSMLRY